MSRRSGILLFNSRGTCACCLDSRRRFNVKMAFTDHDRILMENLYIFKLTVRVKLFCRIVSYRIVQKYLLESFQIKVGL